MWDSSYTLITQTQVAGVKYGTAPIAGDRGLLVRLADNSLYFFAGGGGGSPARLAKASANMTADDTLYNCVYLTAAGVSGDALTAKRPPDTYVYANTVGIIVQDSAGANIFKPLAQYIPMRTSPGVGIVGQVSLIL